MSEELQVGQVAVSPTRSVEGASWIGRLLPIVGIGLLAFLFGMVTAIKQSPPFYAVRDAWLAFCSLSEQQGIMSSQWPKYLWYPAEGQPQGLVENNPAESYGDYTSFVSGDQCSATLVDREGQEIHRWVAPFKNVFPNSRHVPQWIPEQFILMRRGLVYPNGDLLALYETIANTPSGCGLAKLDLAGNVLWAYDDYAHHDVSIGDDGRIYVLVHELRQLTSKDTELNPLTDLPLVEDCVAILSPEGKETKRISLLDALVASPYYRPMLIHVDRYGDITHNNTVHVVDADFAAHYPEMKSGDLMVCLRNLNLVAVVNPESEKIVWATTGAWEHPHDPDPLPNGNIMIFNNFLAHGVEHGSGVVEFDPRKWRKEWYYTGNGAHHLRSDTRSCQQSLDNGNVLITEGDRGRILEVNRAGQTVWEYVHPVRGGEQGDLIPLVCGARRFTREELPFVEQLKLKTRQAPLSGEVAAVGK